MSVEYIESVKKQVDDMNEYNFFKLDKELSKYLPHYKSYEGTCDWDIMYLLKLIEHYKTECGWLQARRGFME